MANFTATTSDAEKRALLTLGISGIQDDPGNNRTLVRITATISDNSANFGGFGTSNWTVSLNGGQVGSGTVAYDFGGNSGRSYQFYIGDFWIGHNADGTGGVSASSTFFASGVVGSATASGSIGLTDYYRGPSWAYISIPSSATRGAGYYGEVGANAASSYGLINGTRVPFGLTFNSNGTITGTPNTVESVSFTFRAYGTFEGSTDSSATITVNPALPVFSDSSVNSSARVGIAYSDGVSASEASSYSVVAAPNNLPPGLSLNTSNGAITGTPTTPGIYSFRIRASNVTGNTDTIVLTIVVISAARVWNGTAFVSGLANVWNGSAFVTGTIRVWDGTTWKNTN
jgi:hypothetical protein